jgi:hypothetical protein
VPTPDLQAQMSDLAACEPHVLPESITATSIETLLPVKRQGNKYVKVQAKANADRGTPDLWAEISNFVLKLLRDEIDIDHAGTHIDLQRYIRLISDEAGIWEGPVSADDLSNLRDFESLLVKKGDFAFYGDAKDLKRIWHMATQESRECRKRVHVKSIVGRDMDSKLFIVGNGAIDSDGTVYPQDEEGLVTVNGVSYRLASRDTSATAGDKMGIPTFDFNTSKAAADANFKDVVQACQRLWGPATELLWGWGLSHLLRSSWIAECANFPLCMAPAPPSTGKNTLMRMFVNLYGLPFSPIMLKGLTEVGLLTQVNAGCDVPVWIDEWKNDAKKELLEMFKSNADSSRKIVGTLDPLKTKSREHRTGLVITGEFRATDTALNQRIIQVELRKNEVDPAGLERAREQSRNLSAFAVHLLKEQQSVWADMLDTYKDVRSKWQQYFSDNDQQVDIRIIENYAKVYAALERAFKDDQREARFKQYMLSKVTESGDMNPAIEALKFMPRFMTGGVGRKGWVPFYVDAKKTKFHVSPKELSRVYCEHNRTTEISSDDLFKYALAAGILHPMQTTPRLIRGSMKMSPGATTTTQGGWVLNLKNETVRDVADELADHFRSSLKDADDSDGDVPIRDRSR